MWVGWQSIGRCDHVSFVRYYDRDALLSYLSHTLSPESYEHDNVILGAMAQIWFAVEEPLLASAQGSLLACYARGALRTCA